MHRSEPTIRHDEIDNLVIEANTIDDIGRQDVLDLLSKHEFCVIRGLVSRRSLAAGIEKLKDFIEKNGDKACTGESPEEVRNYFMKVSMGRGNHSGKEINRGRFMRTIYVPLDKDDRFGLVETFKEVGRVRNLLMNKQKDFALNHAEEGLWTAARVHHFPTGGGFMVPHRDTMAPQLLQEVDSSYQYFQPILVMSEKHKDFQTGGGVAMMNGQLVEYEDHCLFGDIAIYNVNTIHGVNEVDLNMPFVQRSSSGRFSGLVTLYKEI